MPEDSTTKDVEQKMPVEATNTPETTTTPSAKPASNGLAVAAMVIGIVAVVFGWVPFFGLALGATAIVLGVIALKKAQSKGMSITGIVTGIVGAAWNLFMIFALLALGGAAVVVSDSFNKALDEQNKIAQKEADAQKEFNKGETAKFGQFEVKVNSVERNYVSDNEYTQPSEGKEFVVVNLTAKNAGESKSLSSYDLNLSVNGVETSPSYMVSVSPQFDGGTMEKGVSTTGNMVFEVTKGASDMKLTYKTTGFSYKTGDTGLKTYIYSLKI